MQNKWISSKSHKIYLFFVYSYVKRETQSL